MHLIKNLALYSLCPAFCSRLKLANELASNFISLVTMQKKPSTCFVITDFIPPWPFARLYHFWNIDFAINLKNLITLYTLYNQLYYILYHYWSRTLSEKNGCTNAIYKNVANAVIMRLYINYF